ncbi:hypothetical protein BP00DRAFT_448338 [Aspergillus indologenus CBS 114.80]|uniref:Uncharacterized protein n=1 Tax=Aspergillus indologenus CBS 114.80 TaxID=1450541 RepID=A0A2V5I371_9EURO|nr:hypothetical protein BP00DRAFT_448338 [Aspergillus indologenus CBS 114.80]
MAGAKRVILRVPENEMDYQNPREFVDFYFKKFPSNAALDSARHFIHYQPPSDIPQSNAKVHIVIDLETQDFAGTLNQEFPHDIYAVRRVAGNLELYAYEERVKQNLLQKIRVYCDDFYPWGQSRSNQKAEVK